MRHLEQIARIIYCMPLIAFGMGHFANASEMTKMVPGYMPFPIFWVFLTGFALMGASVSIIINKKMRLGSLLLAIMLIIFAFTIHLPNLMSPDQMTQIMGMGNFFRDLGLAGGALFISSSAED